MATEKNKHGRDIIADQRQFILWVKLRMNMTTKQLATRIGVLPKYVYRLQGNTQSADYIPINPIVRRYLTDLVKWEGVGEPIEFKYNQELE